MKSTNCYLVILLLISLLSGNAIAQENSDATADANNPLANMKAFNLNNYYMGELTGSDEDANQFWLRYAKPISIGGGDWLMRASLPINSFPGSSTGGTVTGVGDLNVFAAYLIDTGNPAVSFGFGPQITVPTATKDSLGSEKWSAGFANVLFDGRSKKFQYGYLLTWMASFAGENDRADVSIGAFQPFGMYQLGKGRYLRSTGIWAYNFETDEYTMPVGIGFGKIIKKDKTVYNIFIEPQWSIKDKGSGWPEWQVFVGVNMQFL